MYAGGGFLVQLVNVFATNECIVPPYYVAAMIAIALFPGVGIIRTVDGMIRISRSTILPASLVTETVYYASSTVVSLLALALASCLRRVCLPKISARSQKLRIAE